MREAVGATVLLQILMVFLVIFISFLAVSVNYAQAFRIKNQLVTIIEEYEGWEGYEQGEADDNIREFLNSIHYNIQKNGEYRYEVEKVEAGLGSYYIVSTYLNLDLPLLGVVLDNFKIKGETRIIYRRD